VRLLQHAIKNGWDKMEEIFKNVTGPSFEMTQAGASPPATGINSSGKPIVPLTLVSTDL
jgi:hypothetical protein